MQKKTKCGLWKRIGIGAIVLLLLLLGLPYLLPLSTPSAAQEAAPFGNSAYEQIGGVRFHYRLYHPGSGEPRGKLLLVHGLGGSTFSYEVLAPKIAAQGYLVASVDLPGFGYSGRPPDYDHSQAQRSQDLWQLLLELDEALPQGIRAESWHLLGHSMGGGTVSAMAMSNPGRTKSLILLAPALSDRQGRAFLRFGPLKQWLQVALEHFVLTERNIRGFLSSSFGRPPTADEVEGYLRPLLQPGTARSLARMVDTMRNEDMSGVAAIDTPILAIWGRRDAMVPVGGLDVLKALRPDLSALVIEDAAHCPMETHVTEVAAALLDWLAAH